MNKELKITPCHFTGNRYEVRLDGVLIYDGSDKVNAEIALGRTIGGIPVADHYMPRTSHILNSSSDSIADDLLEHLYEDYVDRSYDGEWG